MDRAPGRDWRVRAHFFHHPHQRFWNMHNAPVFRDLGLRRVPVAVDTFSLRIRALARRARLLGIRRLGRLAPLDRRIVHLDLGLHRNAAQISAMLEWFGDWPNLEIFGFEAHPGFYEKCRRRFAGDKRVRLFNFALVGPAHEGPTATLHLDGAKGLGNSLFAQRGVRTMSVPAVRLSDFLKQSRILAPGDIVTLRMNIEGAELYVIQDLLVAGMLGEIDGFYGMWDDLYKIDAEMDVGFRALLKSAGVCSFPFNDRDGSAIAGSRRHGIIRYDLATSFHWGARRKAPA